MKTHTSTKPESSSKQPCEAAGRSSFCKRLGLCLAAVASLCLAPAATAAARLDANPTFTQVGPNQYHASGPVWLTGATPNFTYIVVLRHPTTGRPASQRVIQTDAHGRALIGNLTETAAAGSQITLGLYFYDRYHRALGAGTPVIRFPASSNPTTPPTGHVAPPPPNRPVVTPPPTPPAASYANLSGTWKSNDVPVSITVGQSGDQIWGTNSDGSSWTGNFISPTEFIITYKGGETYRGVLQGGGRKIVWNGYYTWSR